MIGFVSKSKQLIRSLTIPVYDNHGSIIRVEVDRTLRAEGILSEAEKDHASFIIRCAERELEKDAQQIGHDSDFAQDLDLTRWRIKNLKRELEIVESGGSSPSGLNIELVEEAINTQHIPIDKIRDSKLRAFLQFLKNNELDNINITTGNTHRYD